MPNINSSSLALRRKRLDYEQKHIALLLGHKTTYQISRYETDQRTPNFREAVKLSLLYNLPLSILFESYFRRCREELENSIKSAGLAAKINLENALEVDGYCSYLESMNSDRISETAADRIRRHIKVLIEERSNKNLAG
jgi:transcriptional regulator with XRE-family HTH domain